MSTATAFRAFLNQVHNALNAGEAQDAERLGKAISALVRAERDVAEYLMELRTASENDDHTAIRAELHRRLARFADADRAGSPRDVLAAIAATGGAA